MQIMNCDPKKTMLRKSQPVYEDKKEVKLVVALTGDHLTSVSNESFLSVAAHIVGDDW